MASHPISTAYQPVLAARIPLKESEAGRHVSEAEYWEHYYSHPYFNYEWNNGVLEEVPVANYIQYTLYKWFINLIDHFLLVHQIARMIALETGFRLDPDGGRASIRKPDLGVVLHSNPVSLGDEEHSYKGIFDLVIESMSDSRKSEVERDTVQKKGEYAAAGVKEYFILDPKNNHMHFYRLTRWGTYKEIVPSADGVIRSQVLPGFQFRLRDLLQMPSAIEMASESVYQGFVLPEHQEVVEWAEYERKRADQAIAEADVATKRADAETTRANTEAARADAEAERAKRLEAYIKSLGIDPSQIA